MECISANPTPDESMGNETSSLESCSKKFSEVYLRQIASKIIHPA
jgi:hypothetical protein